MADTSVSERRIRPIQDAIRAGNWRQALKESEKWAKKGETSDRFLTLKTLVLLHQADDKNIQIGANEALLLCQRRPPVVDVEAIHQLQDALALLKMDADDGAKLFERAVDSRPTDVELMTAWLHDGISSANWQSAQKATTALRKAFPKERNYDFWNVLMCLLIHRDESVPQKSRTVFGMLANRMITKTAASPAAEKAIANVEELGLLADVLNGTNEPERFVELCHTEHLAAVAEQDRAFVDTLLLTALGQSGDRGLKKTTSTALLRLDSSEPSEDDRVWRVFLEDALEGQDARDSLEIVDRLLARQPHHRSASLARIRLLNALPGSEDDKDTRVVDACIKFYQSYGGKAICFDNLLSSLQYTSHAVFDRFSGRVQAAVDATSPWQQLFAVKLNLHAALRGELDRGLLTECVERSLDLYDSPSVVSSEAAYIAAYGLTLLGIETKSSTLLLQANTLLNTASLKFKDYYPLRVLLLLVQRLGGQLHLSMQTFWHLSVKNIQWETIGYLLLERISTLHPHQHGRGEESLNPLGATDAALTVLSNSEGSLDRAIREGLKRGSYSNVASTIDLRQKLHRSLVRQLYMIEERKISSLLGHGAFPKFELRQGPWVDVRDTTFMPAYGVAGNRWKDVLLGFPRPDEGWVTAMNLREVLTSYFATRLDTTPAVVTGMVLEGLAKLLEQVRRPPGSLSEAERAGLSVYAAIAALILQRERKADEIVKTETLIEALEALNHREQAPTLNGVQHPNAPWLHRHLIWLEVLQTVATYVEVLTIQGKAASKAKVKTPEPVQQLPSQLRKIVSAQTQTVHDAARQIKDNLAQSGVLGRLVDATLGRVEDGQTFGARLAAVVDESAVEEYCGLCRDSWEDALDGVLAIQVKVG